MEIRKISTPVIQKWVTKMWVQRMVAREIQRRITGRSTRNHDPAASGNVHTNVTAT